MIQKSDNIMNEEKKECILECVLDKETRTCEGCGRTLEEIAEAGRQAKCLENEDPMRYIII